uniref:Uncharacterized protein n=1 Tax=Schistocephalus solidus TaxID=70667 RepID=A0A0X3NG26_SCHSO
MQLAKAKIKKTCDLTSFPILTVQTCFADTLPLHDIVRGVRITNGSPRRHSCALWQMLQFKNFSFLSSSEIQQQKVGEEGDRVVCSNGSTFTKVLHVQRLVKI